MQKIIRVAQYIHLKLRKHKQNILRKKLSFHSIKSAKKCSHLFISYLCLLKEKDEDKKNDM